MPSHVGCIARAAPPPPVTGERFASPLSVVWMSYCPHPPTTTTWRTFYLTQFTAGGGAPEEPGRAELNPSGFSILWFGLSGGRPGRIQPRGARGVQLGGRTPIPPLVKILQQK